MARSRTLWLFALDELLLAAGWLTAAYLAYTCSQLSRAWGHLSVFGALISARHTPMRPAARPPDRCAPPRGRSSGP